MIRFNRFTALQRKIINGISVLYFFTTRNFQFETKKLQELFSELDAEDQSKFYFDHTTIDWDKFFSSGILQTRRLLLKEDDATIDKAKSKLRKLYYADIAVKAISTFVFLYYTLKLGKFICSQF